MAQYSSSATRIGNWVEEAAAQEAAALDKLHLDSAASPLSRAQRGERSVAAGRTRVPLTSASEDGFVRFGDRVVLQSEVVPGCMAACPESVGDPLGEQPATQACCASLAALHGAHDGCAAARCVLLLESVPARSVDDEALQSSKRAPDGVLYYGAKVRLVLRPEGEELLPPRLGAALALSSFPRTSTRFASKSKRQLVAFIACDAQPVAPESIWTVLPASGSSADSLLLAGAPVALGAPLALRHAATGQCLSCEAPGCTVSTAWAAREGEVAAFTHAPPGAGRTAAMERFNQGQADHEVANLRLAPQNLWRLCADDGPRAADSPAGAADQE